MYEQKIIENLREFSAKYQYEDQKLSETCFRAADAIEKLQSQLPKWISVSERLPDSDEGLVLVCMPNEFPYNGKQPFTNVEHDCRVRIAIYVIDEWYLEGYKMSRQKPIAWMKLPKPYELQKEVE